MLGRLGRWCADHRWLVLAAWGVVLVLGVVAGSAVVGRLQGGSGAAHSFESVDWTSCPGWLLLSLRP